MANTPRLSMPELTENQASKYVTHNSALRDLDALVQCSVIDSTLTEPPSGPADGDLYIVASGGTSDWSGEDFNLAYYESSAWSFHTPEEGWIAYDQTAGKVLVYKGSSAGWTDLLDARVPLRGAFLGTPTADDAYVFAIDEALTLPDDFMGSYAACVEEASDSPGVDFDIQLNGISIGTMSFASGSGETSATFQMSSTGAGAESLAAGDILSIVAPNPADSTLAHVGFTILATRTST